MVSLKEKEKCGITLFLRNMTEQTEPPLLEPLQRLGEQTHYFPAIVRCIHRPQ
jgi:hypothetical protein